jgi:hypothetical protein
MTATLQADWRKIGPMPTDDSLEDKLSRVRHENNHVEADESVWIKFGHENAELYASAEREFFLQLDKSLK